jgi:hypothetical protein
MNRKLHSRLLLISSMIFLVQCSPGGFQPATSPIAEIYKSNSGSTIADTPQDTAAKRQRELEKIISNADMSGIVDQGLGSSSTVRVIDFDRKNGLYLMRIPMTAFGSVMALDMTFPEYPGMRLYLEYISSLPYITIAIPVKYVLRNVTEVPAKLPSGDRVPLFMAGEPPSKGILLTPNRDRKIYLYLSAEAFGLFAETSFNPLPAQLNELTLAIRDKGGSAKPALGYLTFVPKKGEYNGGFFVSSKLDPKLGKILDEYYLD